MRIVLLALAVIGLLLWPYPAIAREQRLGASLLVGTSEPLAGSSILVGVRFQPAPQWHGYWSNPGESGLAPTVSWTAPEGVGFGPLQHPAPSLLRVAGISSYVHAGEHVLLSHVRVPAGLAPGTRLPIEANLRWLACSERLCVPERATLSTVLVVGEGKPGEAASALRRAAAQLPRRVRQNGELVRRGDDLRFILPEGVSLRSAQARFFPDTNGLMEPTTSRISGRDLIIRATGATPKTVSGVLSDGRSAYQVRFRQAPDAAPAPATASADLPKLAAEAAPVQELSTLDEAPLATPSAEASGVPPEQDRGSKSRSLLLAVSGALLGGLLLNLMPCVFPVLSLKALHLAKAGTEAREAKRDALGYALGAVAGCSFLGLAVLGLRQAGLEVGWSFQLQNPAVILALFLLVTTIALNLAGLFEVRGPAVSGSHGALASGALAAVIATPCSGPFMATALGAALILSPAAALLVFAALGLGLALPYLLLAFVPALRTRLPRPGRWMETLRKILAVPMLLTAVALLWLIGRQSGVDEMGKAVLLVLLLGVSLWWLGVRQRGNRVRPGLPLIPALAVIAVMLGGAPPRASANASTTADHVLPFSEARLAELRRRGRPVFVDFTADWCLTCKVNEKLAIDRAETQQAFRKAGIVTVEGDWTNGDPEITRFLSAHGRNSIPFYLYYPPGEEPRVLPQLLTPALLQNLAHPVTEG